MSENVQVKSGGVGFPGLLTVLFVGLKLTGYIKWAWVWVLSPLWVSLLFGLLVLLVVGIIALIVYLCEK